MRKGYTSAIVALAATGALITAPAASAAETVPQGDFTVQWESYITGALTGFESRRWTVEGGSSTVNFTGCESTEYGSDLNSTHVGIWQDLTLRPDVRIGNDARLTACFNKSTSSFTRDISTGARAYFRIARINGDVSGSRLSVDKVVVNE